MSLVNDMLNDLEQKRSQQPRQESTLDWLTASQRDVSGQSLSRYLPAVIIVLCVIAIAWLYFPRQQTVTMPAVSVAPALEPQATVEPSQTKENNSAEPVAVETTVIQAAPAPEKPVAVQIPETDAVSSVQSVVESKPAPKALARKVAVKKPLPLSPEQRDSKTAREAKALLQKRDLVAAEKRLQQQIAAQPESLQSGQLLVSLLLTQQRLAEGQSLLTALSESFSDNVALRILQARLHLQAGEEAQALTYLQQQQPVMGLHQEYYQLLAQLAQRQEDYALAERTYSSLLQVDVDRADWWFGLALAFDSQLQSQNAVAAYQRALRLSGLKQTLQAYAEQRLSVLGRGR